MQVVELVGPGGDDLAWAATLLPEKDAAVLAAARAAAADVLLTGDLQHFGSLMTRRDLALRVSTVREFLLGGGARPERPRAHPSRTDHRPARHARSRRKA
jgi:hypothetical protein